MNINGVLFTIPVIDLIIIGLIILGLILFGIYLIALEFKAFLTDRAIKRSRKK
ncbi:MAG: hypothetical protein LLF82_000297 [Dehalococcoides mccartyi]|nr:hypothetical protein [Dehalococcoides mccartyi]